MWRCDFKYAIFETNQIAMQDIKSVGSWEIERSKYKHKYMFRGSSYCSASVPSYRRIFTMSTKDLPRRDLHWEITTANNEYTTPTLTPLHKRVGTKQL